MKECTHERSLIKCEGKDQWVCFVSEALGLQDCFDSLQPTLGVVRSNTLSFWLQYLEVCYESVEKKKHFNLDVQKKGSTFAKCTICKSLKDLISKA
jgi:hypothetical protein